MRDQISPWLHPWAALLDAWDHARARRHRRMLWRRAWLVTWDRPVGGRAAWIARVSCPDLPVTVARRGRSRCHALRRARAVLDRLQSPD